MMNPFLGIVVELDLKVMAISLSVKFIVFMPITLHSVCLGCRIGCWSVEEVDEEEEDEEVDEVEMINLSPHWFSTLGFKLKLWIMMRIVCLFCCGGGEG